MKITFMTLQKASIVCLGVGMFLALGSAGTFETTGEIQTGVYVTMARSVSTLHLPSARTAQLWGGRTRPLRGSTPSGMPTATP